MFIRRDLIIVMVALMAAALIAGCGAARKDSGGDQTTAPDVQEQISQVLNCSGCHPQYGEWLSSRHVDANNSPNRAGNCIPCHTGIDVIGDFIEPEPKYFVDCASCHEPDGTKHGAINANLRNATVNTPGGRIFPTCTLCHDFNAGEPPYGSQHYLDSDRSWSNASGDSAHSAHSVVTGSSHIPVAVADMTIASVAFSVFSLPVSSDASWQGNYAGPYNFVPDRVIKDTHFNEVWILNEDDKATRFAVATAKLGYVDLTDSSPSSGMVRSDDAENACLASCHSPHAFDKTVQQQWAEGAHHPIPLGPVVDIGGDPFPSAPVNWGAVDHDFSSGCLRCHSAAGFAELNGTFGNAVATSNAFGEAGAFITCNACHDGVDYPTRFNSRLRLDGDALFFNNDGSVRLTVEEAGPSATCMYCHQGRESGITVANAIAAADTHPFINRHYLAAAAILNGSDAMAAFQYSGQSYEGPNTFPGHPDENNQDTCVGCHLRSLDDHTFKPALADCSECHTGIADFDDINLLSGNVDYDGDGVASSFQDEIDGMLAGLLSEIQLYATTVLGLPIIYSPNAYPYFFNDNNPANGVADPVEISFLNRYQTFDDSLLAAGYNYHSGRDPCGDLHNYRYVIQSLYDSIDDLDNGALDGSVQFAAGPAIRP